MEHHNSYNKKDKVVLHTRQITVNEILMVDQDLDQVEVPEVVVMEAQVQPEAAVEMELEVVLIVDLSSKTNC
jgi:hypothetical protein